MVNREFTMAKIQICSFYGLPETLVLDNGPQLRSKEFKTYCKSMELDLQPMLPFRLQSNGAAERIVESVKGAIGKQGIEDSLEGTA
ncbi:hypothetical protein PR048_019038 [Dryococelus australis]|uniref:Integrase catalytic domain-containing protein n=1 Tax=Dryococelus australis TaxID=614101 RepID=A0ABQ9H2D2_9NEOP|nr:hypothetical protein PR048_019038 [Dryococelus australis]